jgi:hypothetical protein
MKIQGIEGMSPDRLQFEIQRGAKLVVYQYAVSVLVMSFRRSSDVSSSLPERALSPRDCLGV